MEDKTIVHDRVGVQGQYVPIEENTFRDVPEEFYEDLLQIQEYSVELNNARLELGRLMQIVNHLVNVCNTTETNLTNVKQGIIKGMELGDGNWAINFEDKKIGLVSSVQKPMPRVV